MSKRKNNTSEIEFPEKGSEFVLTTEKIGKLLVRNNLKKLGRDILSNMYLLNEPLSLFSLVPAFKTTSVSVYSKTKDPQL